MSPSRPPEGPHPTPDHCRPRPTQPPRPLPQPDELRELLERCLVGEREAWNSLVSRFSRLVLSTVGRTFVQFARPELGEVADDASQEVFLSLLDNDYRTLRTLRDPGHFPGWLAAVARNKAIDTLRRLGPAPAPLEDASGGGLVVYPTAEAQEASAARVSMVHEALGSLKPGDRLLIELFYFEDRRYRDIALLLGIPENTVASRLYRIKRRLLRHLAEAPPREEGNA